MGLLTFLHTLADKLLSSFRLVQNREVGWQTLDRKTGRFLREQQPLWKKFKLLVLFNPITDWIDTTHAMRLWTHEKTVTEGFEEGTKRSKQRIKPFIDFYKIRMEDFDPSDPDAYATFEDFFVRKHKVGSRPIFEGNDRSSAVVVADSRVVTYESLAETKRLWIKGQTFTIENLLMDRDVAAKYSDAAVASFRLSPQDYHRYHSPVTGTLRTYRSLPGEYYNVDPIAITSGVDILTRNARCWVAIETEEFGMVVFVAIGATDVGTVR